MGVPRRSRGELVLWDLNHHLDLSVVPLPLLLKATVALPKRYDAM